MTAQVSRLAAAARRPGDHLKTPVSWRTVVTVLLVGVGVCSPAAAQMTGGTISGAVTDSTQAVVPDAEVTIVNQATGVSRTVSTNDKGFFTAPNLVSGRYDVTVSRAGFTTAVRKSVLVEVGQEAVANIQLRIGAVTESTEVTSQASGVALSSAVLSDVVEGQTVRDLPINGRDWTLLAAMEPGVHTMEAQVSIGLGAPDRSNRGWGTQMMVGGNRPQQNNYRLDGISINDFSGAGLGSVLAAVLGVDAIEEFSVVTGNASAEYGKVSGGVLNAVTRSGQNTLHGSGYEFLRNGKLDAPNFFDRGVKPPFERDQFGASLGGPLRKDRTFFFVAYEGLRQNLSTTTDDTVPSRAAHGGQLTSGTVAIDPRVAPFLALFPLPNGPENGNSGVFSFVSKATTHEDLFTGRLDHRFSTANSLRGTFMTDSSETTGPDPYNFVVLGQESRRRMVSVEDTHILRPSLVNIARMGYSHSASVAPIDAGSIDPRGDDPSLGFEPGRMVGTIRIAGITDFVGGLQESQTRHRYHSYQFYDDLLYTRGAHSLKFGVAVERIQTAHVSASDANGNYSFGSLEAFLTNVPQAFQSSTADARPTIYLRETVLGVYAQDDFRARANLTLHLGLRYETASVPTEKYGRLTNLVNLTDTQPRLGSPYFDNPTRLDFSPRVGFSWDPFRNGRTAVRGGFGIYDTLPLPYQFILLVLNSAPFYQASTVTALPAGSFPTGAFAALTPAALRYAHIQTDPQRPYVAQWNINVERQLPASFVLHLGYVGEHGAHQPFRTTDANIVLPADTEQGLLWPAPRASGTRLNPNVGQINSLAWISSNTYHGMNVHLSRSRGRLRFGLSYTLSKSMDNSSSSVISNFQNSIPSPFLQFPELMWGPSDFDLRHNVVLNYLWNVPGAGSANAGARWLKNGWQLGGILRAASGLPFSPLIGGDALGQRNTNPYDVADRLDTPECESPVNPGNPGHYIKTECFLAPQPGTRLGNSGRNSVRGPGLSTVDVSLFKNNYVGRNDRVNIQLRTEFFNVLNHPNFSVPNRTVSQIFDQNLGRLPNAGRLNSTSTTARQIQFAVKLMF
jgi:hypothetical protein